MIIILTGCSSASCHSVEYDNDNDDDDDGDDTQVHHDHHLNTQGVLLPFVTVLGLVGNSLSIMVLHSPGVDMKVFVSVFTFLWQ